MSLILAIDQSTSATKALLFDADGRALDRESREHKQHYPQPGWVEHDADEIWANVVEATRALLARNGARIGDIAGISIANQRETFVIFDRTTSRPLHPAIVWQCRRGDRFCAEQVANGREKSLRARTGLRVDSYFSAPKMQWLIRERADLAARLRDGSACLGTIDAYLIHRLTGGAVFATDHTNASRTLLFDIARLDWDDELCAWWQVPRVALPEVRASSQRFGTTTMAGVLPRPVPICGVMGDSQASLFAHRCFEPGTAKVTFGSGSSVLLNVGSSRPRTDSGSVATLAWVLDGKPRYAAEGIITSSASTITWLRDQLGLIAGPAETEALARAVEGNGGVYLVPAFSGLGAPYWDEEARAAIVGLSAHSDRRHVVRAALESIGFQLRDVLDSMRADSGVKLQRLQGDGGATANKFLMQFCADLSGVELRVGNNPNLSALGAAWMGALGLGLHASPSKLLALPQPEESFRPNASASEVENLLTGWHRAVRRVMLDC
ncbi:MAG: glycerol kinase GlpK [Opitutaceae bacterium]|nr:glycerol kinase GlpK [Opitutaceae bacterium]